MSFVAHSCPPESEPWPGSGADEPAPPGRLARLAAERATLLALVRPRVRSDRQERIRRRITDLTRQILGLSRGIE